MASSIEKTMNERREQAEAEARRKYPNLRDVSVAFFGTNVIVDVKDTHGHWRRFRHIPEIDVLAAEAADAATERREVTHGRPA